MGAAGFVVVGVVRGEVTVEPLTVVAGGTGGRAGDDPEDPVMAVVAVVVVVVVVPPAPALSDWPGPLPQATSTIAAAAAARIEGIPLWCVTVLRRGPRSLRFPARP
jgi:hypothetical protein